MFLGLEIECFHDGAGHGEDAGVAGGHHDDLGAGGRQCQGVTGPIGLDPVVRRMAAARG